MKEGRRAFETMVSGAVRTQEETALALAAATCPTKTRGRDRPLRGGGTSPSYQELRDTKLKMPEKTDLQNLQKETTRA